MDSQDKIAGHLHGIYFSALKGCNYHSLRMEFLDKCHRWSMFIVILMSSSSLFYIITLILQTIWGENLDEMMIHMHVTAVFSLITLIVSTSGIVFSWTNMARHHEMLYNKWSDLIERMDYTRTRNVKIRVADYEQFVTEHNRAVKAEGAVYLGLDAIAYNNASRTYGYNQFLIIPLPVALFKNVLKFSNMQFSIAPESNSKKPKKSKPSGK